MSRILAAMFFNLAILFSLLTFPISAHESVSFTYNGFRSASLTLDGIANVMSNGLLQLTNNTRLESGHAFYSEPLPFKNSPKGTVFSFSTTFIVAIISEYPTFSGHGMALVISPTRSLPDARQSQYLGLFNEKNNGNMSNHVVAIELDTVQNIEFLDVNNNHAGININGLTSEVSEPIGYHDGQTGQFRNMSLVNGKRIQVWVEYDGIKKRLDVTLAPVNIKKPSTPLLSVSRDLLRIFRDRMYVGFSSSTGSLIASHYILGWSFTINGTSHDLVLSQLPRVPRRKPRSHCKKNGLQ